MALVAEVSSTDQDELTERLLHAAAEVVAENGYEKAGVAESEENKLGQLIKEAAPEQDIDQLALMRLAHAIGFGMTLTRTIGLDLPSRDDWTTVINLVIEAFINNETKIHGG